jgi:superfamily II DNA/RNA helicase
LSEQAAFDYLLAIEFAKIDNVRSAGLLFKTTLIKSLLSSPVACIKTIQNRVHVLTKKDEADYQNDIHQLETLQKLLEKISPEQFSKYQTLKNALKSNQYGSAWKANDSKDRLVIFTERIESLKFLEQQLSQDLKLKKGQVEILHGSLADTDQQRIVEDFGQENSKVRLLICSDVASEGINLHYLSHRMVHFDIPWSLMVFQQRNGRIDRYGQEQTHRLFI